MQWELNAFEESLLAFLKTFDSRNKMSANDTNIQVKKYQFFSLLEGVQKFKDFMKKFDLKS